MTDRIPLDDMTSDALDALYERLEAAEDTETQRQLATARKAFASATSRAARAEKDLTALRQVARGYCPECGRGDCAPTAADWEQQKTRADQAEDLLRIAHATSNQSEAERARAVQHAEQAEAARARVQALADECEARGEASGHPLTVTRVREALDTQPKERP